MSLPYQGEEEAQVLHLDEEGTASPRPTWQEEGRVSFETGHFSVYAIAPAGWDNPAPDGLTGQETEGAEQAPEPSPAGLAARLAVLGLAALGVWALGKKRS